MNFLRTSAGSVVHPHLQTLILPVAPPLLAFLLQESKNYHKKNKQDFFGDYFQLERDSPRWIGDVGTEEDRVSWLSPWAPLAGSDEVMFSSNSYSAFPLRERIWQNIAEGLHKIFLGYHKMGIYSINFVIFSDTYGAQNEFFRVTGMIWSRPLKNLDISDRGFAEIGYKMALTFRSPEMVAADLRKYW
jgi:galactose-1-phosphate uridylyltransferase